MEQKFSSSSKKKCKRRRKESTWEKATASRFLNYILQYVLGTCTKRNPVKSKKKGVTGSRKYGVGGASIIFFKWSAYFKLDEKTTWQSEKLNFTLNNQKRKEE
jgi:hypothetical protein